MPEQPARAAKPARRTWLRFALGVFYLALAAMLYIVVRKLDLDEIARALRALPTASIVLASACSALVYALYAGYEILAARTRGVPLSRARLARIGFTSYAFNLSLGSVIGALGVRLRLYANERVAAADSVGIVALNLMTNWSGYFAVLGIALFVHAGEPPQAWWLGSGTLRAIGVGASAVALGYAWACARARRRTWDVRGQRFELPHARVAVRQFALSIPAWLAGAGGLAILLADVAFDQVVIAMLAASVIGLVIRVPAGLGVLEAVFVASFGPELGNSRVLAAMLAFRCVHYLVPLSVGLALFLLAEWRARRLAPA